MTDSHAGRLLVAGPELLDPNFHRAVVLLLAHDEDGATGLVLNRPLTAGVEQHLPGLGEHATQPAVVFAGGPVQLETVLALGRAFPNASPPWALAVNPRLGLLDLGAPPGSVPAGLEAIRFFSGHAGWGEGQLEAELAEPAWFVVDAAPGDAFTAEPGALWQTVLRRQPGRLAMYAFTPTDPSVN